MALRNQPTTPPKRRQPPAKTPEGREMQLMAYAMDLAEQQLIDGTATSQVITHFLKAASSRDQLEKTRIEAEIRLQEARRQNLMGQEDMKQLMEDALKAMTIYQGRDDEY